MGLKKTFLSTTIFRIMIIIIRVNRLTSSDLLSSTFTVRRKSGNSDRVALHPFHPKSNKSKGMEGRYGGHKRYLSARKSGSAVSLLFSLFCIKSCAYELFTSFTVIFNSKLRLLKLF